MVSKVMGVVRLELTRTRHKYLKLAWLPITSHPRNSESIGLDPNTLAGTIYLAGSPRTPSGLLSIDLAEDGGNEPQTFRFTLLSKQVSEPSDIIFYIGGE